MYSKVKLKLGIVLVIIFSTYAFDSTGKSKILIKANIIRGEIFITAKTNASKIESAVGEIFTEKGFTVLNNIETTEDILFVDFFAYQFLGQYPVVSITIRSKNGIHYIDQLHSEFFLDRSVTNLTLASELAKKVPSDISKEYTYSVRMVDILATFKSPVARPSDNMYKVGALNYYSILKWPDANKAPFIIPNELEFYLFYISNYIGLKKVLAKSPIILKVKIGNSARLELLNMETTSNLNDNQKARIQEFIDSFPLWIVNPPVENIEIVYGLK